MYCYRHGLCCGNRQNFCDSDSSNCSVSLINFWRRESKFLALPLEGFFEQWLCNWDHLSQTPVPCPAPPKKTILLKVCHHRWGGAKMEPLLLLHQAPRSMYTLNTVPIGTQTIRTWLYIHDTCTYNRIRTLNWRWWGAKWGRWLLSHRR